jgi:hypothetical protein
VFVLGAAGSASASTLLFESEKPDWHATGLTVSTGLLATVGGKKIESTAAHVLILVLNQTLFHIHILFLGVHAEGTTLAPCGDTSTTTSSGHILLAMLGHLGLADPGGHNAVLLLIPSGFSFFCHNPILNINEEVKVQGSVIGEITKPAVGVATEELGIKFEQSAGKQKFTEFLLPENVLMTNQFLESKTGGGAFEQAGEATEEIVLKALPGAGKFKLVLDAK